MLPNLDLDKYKDRLPPVNIEAEEAILGGILLDPEAMARVVDLLPCEAFSLEAHRIIFGAAKSIYEENVPTDLMSVTTRLADKQVLEKIGGANKLVQLINRTVSAVNIDQYAALVVDKYMRRRLIATGCYITDLGFKTAVELPEVLTEADNILAETTTISSAHENYFHNEEQIRLNRLTKDIEAVEKIKDPFQKKFKLHSLMKTWGVKTEKEFLDFHSKWLERNSKCRSMSIDEYFQAHGSQATEWALQGWIPRTGITVLHAMGSTGKTILLSHLTKWMISGTSWCGYEIKRPLKVLWIQCDQGAKVTIRLFDKQGFFALDTVVKERLRIIDKWGIEEYWVIEKELEKHDYDLVVVDSLATVSANLIYRENDQEFARPLARYRQLSERYNTAFVILHHSDWQGKMRGSTAIFNAADQVWGLKKTLPSAGSEEKQIDLTVEKSRYVESPCTYRLRFNTDQFGWDLLGEVTQGSEGEEVNDNTARHSFQKIVKFLKSYEGKGFESREIADLLEMGLATVRKELGYGTKKGLIESLRGNRARNIYFVGTLNTPNTLDASSVSIRTKDLNDPETGSLPNPYPVSVDPFDPIDPQFSSLSIETANSKNPGSIGSNGSIHTQREFQNDPALGSFRSLVRDDTGSGLSVAIEVDNFIHEEANDARLTDDDIQEFAEMIQQAIADPTLTESVQQTLSTFFAEHPQEKHKVWKKLDRSERESFKALTAKPLDGIGKEVKVGDRVKNLTDEKFGTGLGSVISLDPQYRGSPRDRFVQWKATVKWDFGSTADEVMTTTCVEMVQVLDPATHLEPEPDEAAPTTADSDSVSDRWEPKVGDRFQDSLGNVATITAILDDGRFEFVEDTGTVGVCPRRFLNPLSPENAARPKPYLPKVGDRCQDKNGRPLTVKEVKSSCLIGIYDTEVATTSLGLCDVTLLPPETDPKIIAQKLFETLAPGTELRALKHPSHKGFARRRGIVVAKFKGNGKLLAKCQTNAGIEVFNLEAVEVL